MTRCWNGYGSLHASHADERSDHEEAIKRLQGEHKRFGERINAMYLDKLDGRVDGVFFDKMSAQWREEQNRCLREIARHEAAEQSYMDEGVQILELARNAQKLFERQQPREKRRLLNFILSNCSWEDGEVVATFRQPFDLLSQTTAIATRAAGNSDSNWAKSEIWLPFLDTYRTMCRAPKPAFRQILEDIRDMRFAA
jgi:site-specific DNA recombinase